MADEFKNLRFGVKEVADVRFYKVGDVNVDTATGIVSLKDASVTPALALDTLKVSTIENTAESVAARGGKGNPKLVVWDYNREATLTLEDALMSIDSLELMYGESVAAETNVITINARKFPGTYSVVGKTYARDTNGVDHVFTFYIPKAKVTSENTLTMEAEGDPSTFSMTLEVLRVDEQGKEGDLYYLILEQNKEGTENPEIKWPEAATE